MDLFDHDRRQLDRIERLLIAIAHKSDIIIHMETSEMALTDDIKAKEDALLAELNSDTDLISSISAAQAAQTAQIADLQTKLQAAIDNGADSTALQAISDEMTAITQVADAQKTALAVVANTTPPAGTGTTPPAPPVAGPVITSIDPAVGPESGNTSISISGTGFAAADSVTVGGVAATGIVVNSPTSITASTPAGTGDVPVVVTDGAGNSNAASPAATFRYVAAPAA